MVHTETPSCLLHLHPPSDAARADEDQTSSSDDGADHSFNLFGESWAAASRRTGSLPVAGVAGSDLETWGSGGVSSAAGSNYSEACVVRGHTAVAVRHAHAVHLVRDLLRRFHLRPSLDVKDEDLVVATSTPRTRAVEEDIEEQRRHCCCDVFAFVLQHEDNVDVDADLADGVEDNEEEKSESQTRRARERGAESHQ
eukprot:CAMPEP_0202818522 /NCGR_PEP_ID=MMETSP1389-20130828/8401_1 /ASSEMBLY_ACC=CAM_ASM_000865 /TAXON_ID=302021 /ORGANISM="Rhodomonas sp., Strain CCMP768" /LENGTH=196 /DNA_ID=CAMNT_0049490895 /DNA_START=65 /DNA_END=653 /DNA_ORIENTATION=-